MSKTSAVGVSVAGEVIGKGLCRARAAVCCLSRRMEGRHFGHPLRKP